MSAPNISTGPQADGQDDRSDFESIASTRGFALDLDHSQSKALI